MKGKGNFQLLLAGLFVPFLLLTVQCRQADEKITPPEAYDQLTIMTFNILYSSPADQTVAVIRETNADIVGLQEISKSRLADLARQLHYQYVSFSANAANLSDQDTGILSRFPITQILKNGARIRVNPDLEVAVFTVHLLPYPYEPYDFRDETITTAAQAIASASKSRLPAIQSVIETMEPVNDSIPVFLTGDFNEPSWLDWTNETAALSMHFGKVVEWPVSHALASHGLQDVYRSFFTSPVNFPGNTWTTLRAADEVYDRIDIIYQGAAHNFTIQDIRLVGGAGDNAGITVQGYASDHYAVLATFSLH